MFVKKNSCKNGRVLLTFTRCFRVNGKNKQKHVETLGYLDELEKLYDDPIAHFREIAKQRTQEETLENEPVQLTLDLNTPIGKYEVGLKNLGYTVFEKLYHELGIHTFFARHENRLNIDFNLNAIFRLLVYSRILDPGSKKQAYDQQDQFFETMAPSLDSVYRSLDYFDRFNLDLQAWLNEAVKKQYGRNRDYAYYDVTNYYFEIDEEDELRRRGPSKEHRPDPIVQMGLLLDNQGLPLAYHLFPGNESEKLSLNPLLNRLKEDYGLGRLVVVADKGLNCGDNIAYQLAQGNGYIYSQSIRGADQEFKQYILEQSGYRKNGDNSRCKSRIYPKEISFTDAQGKKKKSRVDQKQVVFYSQDYADQARYERSRTVAKARKYLQSPASLKRALAYSAASYIQGLQYDKDGEIIETKAKLYLDEARIREEEQYDGYYAIVTSELKMSDADIIETYHGLWHIEETFKISKSDFKTRPVYVSLEAHIEAHFLTCFVALLLTRILELRMNKAEIPAQDGKPRLFSAFELLNSLRKYTCSHVSENVYSFHYTDEVIHNIEKVFGIDLDKRFRKRGDIRNFIASMKK
ncbi:MAG: IS1634 family transposase [Clostridiaceae bacterium]|nr:IS1634 family transposase [Clostridiaceae bacterium]